MHPLEVALASAGLTQGQLSASIAALGWKRDNGKPLRLTQSAISEICNWKRRTMPWQAKACVEVLSACGLTVEAADLVFAQRPEPKKPSRKRSAA